MQQDTLDRWIENLDEELHLSEDKFGFVPSEQVENHNASFENPYNYLKAGLNKIAKCLQAL